MKRILIMMLIAAVSILPGCGAKTTGKDITTKNEFNFGDVYAPVTISPNLSTQSGDTEQDVAAPTEIKTDGELILTPSAQLDKAAQGLADAKILAKASELSAAKPVKTNEQHGLEDKPPGEIKNDTPGTSKTKDLAPSFVVRMRQLGAGSKMFNWLGKTGEELSGPLRIETSGCGTFVIPDPTRKWAENGDINNHDQPVYFPGNWPGQDTHPLGFASFVTGRDCYSDGVVRDMTIYQNIGE